MKELELLLKNIAKGILFLLIMIILFNTLSDFTYELGLTSEVLSEQDRINFFALAYFLSVFNYFSSRFSGIAFVR